MCKSRGVEWDLASIPDQVQQNILS
jgi:hypothetical protein